MKKQRLLLWDIDGTLISTGAAGQRAIALATAQQFGGSSDLDGVEIAGRTDTGIAHQILAKYGEPITEERLESFLKLYLELLAHELPRSQGRVQHRRTEPVHEEQKNITISLNVGPRPCR